MGTCDVASTGHIQLHTEKCSRLPSPFPPRDNHQSSDKSHFLPRRAFWMSTCPKHSNDRAILWTETCCINIKDIYTCKDSKRFRKLQGKDPTAGLLDLWEDLEFQVCTNKFNIIIIFSFFFFFWELLVHMHVLSLSEIVKWIGCLK